MEIKIDVINRSSWPLPVYETENSAGCDLRANILEPLVLVPFARKVVGTGLYMSIPSGYEVQIRPRSGLAAKHGITVLNAPGTIDSDYRGEVGVILVNLSTEPYTINPGDRIAQMVVARHERAVWNNVDSLDETERGKGGFGHTGNG